MHSCRLTWNGGLMKSDRRSTYMEETSMSREEGSLNGPEASPAHERGPPRL